MSGDTEMGVEGAARIMRQIQSTSKGGRRMTTLESPNAELHLYEAVLGQLSDAINQRNRALAEGQGWTGLAQEIESLSAAALHLLQMSEQG